MFECFKNLKAISIFFNKLCYLIVLLHAELNVHLKHFHGSTVTDILVRHSQLHQQQDAGQM